MPVGFGDAVDPKTDSFRKMNSSQKNHRKDFFYIKICRNDVSGEAEEVWLILENVFCREVVAK